MIHYGDCRDGLKTIAASNIRARTCITSPPYFGVRDYGGGDGQIGLEKSPEEYVTSLVEIFRLVRDVLTEDGTLWLNLGDCYYNYRAGKGSIIPKQSHAKTFQDFPKGECLRRSTKIDWLKEKDLIGIPWMVAFALRADGWYLRQDIIWSKNNPQPESVKDRCTKSHEYLFLLSKNQNYYFDVEAIAENGKDGGKRRKRSVWETNTSTAGKGLHFGTFPPQLIRPCVLSATKPNDYVLDPFLGSGTTAVVAKSLGRNYIGCELNAKYKALIEENLGLDKTPERDYNICSILD